MKKEDHINITKMFFDSGYGKVHEWLDSSYAKYVNQRDVSVFYHWTMHHHLKAVTDKYRVSSVECQVACLHIVCDWLSHFCTFQFPKDREECTELI